MIRLFPLIGFLCFLLANLPAAEEAFAKIPYQMTFRGYSAEALRGVEEYIVEFPQYEGLQMVDEGPQGTEYEYRSGAKADEIAASLRRMFLYLDVEGGIEIDDRRITVTHPDYTEPQPPELAALPAHVEQAPLQAPAETTTGGETETQTTLQAPPMPAPAPKIDPAPAPKLLTLRLTTTRGETPSFLIGETLDLTVVLSRDAWLYCYYRQVDGSVVKFFPNPHHKDAKLKGGTVHRIPGDIYPFGMLFTEPPGNELLTCYATGRDVHADLPEPLQAPDFAILPTGMDDRLQDIFDGLAKSDVARDSLPIAVKR